MKKLLMMIPAALALLMTSCLEHHVTVSLNKDGSGTVTEETLLGAQMLAMVEQMAAMGGPDAEAPDPTAEMADPAKAEAKAKKMGEGVIVQKIEKIDKDGAKGARITYAFKDINQVKYAFGDSLSDMGPGGAAPPAEETEPLSFSYEDGVLTLKNKAMDAEKPGDDEPAPEADPAQLAQAKQMLNGMKMSIQLTFPGGIEETNATHLDGNTVTMMEMDMGKLLEDPETFAKLQKEQPESPAAMAEALKGIEGMKFEPKKELRVKLK